MIRLWTICLLITAPLWGRASDGFRDNKGQWPVAVAYRAQVAAGQAWFTDHGVRFTWMDTADYRRLVAHEHHAQDYAKPMDEPIGFHVYDLVIDGVDSVRWTGHRPSASYSNYFTGHHATRACRVRDHRRVVARDVLPGIDWAFVPSETGFKHTFTLAADADPSDLGLRLPGADDVHIDPTGRLVIETAVGDVVEDPPLAWDASTGDRVACRFVLDGDVVRFHLPDGRPADHDLVIDPDIVFSSLTGSFADNFGYTATYDGAGNAYAAGSVFDVGYPTTTGAFDVTFNGNEQIGLTVGTDIGITKFSADGSTVLFSTYLGGSFNELPHSLIVNAQDELILFGTTSSRDFPTTAGSYDSTFNGGPTVEFQGLNVGFSGSDIIVCRMSPDGTDLLASTYVGGSENDGLNQNGPLTYNYADEVRGEVIVDGAGNIYVAASTLSADFPTTPGAVQTGIGGLQDACIFKMDASLSTLIWSTLLGGSDVDGAYSMAIDEAGHLVVAGGTRSPDFPVLNAWQPTYGGGRADGFIAKLHENGQLLLHSTFYGRDTYDQIYFVDLGRDDSIHVLGQTLHTGAFFNDGATFGDPGAGQFISKFDAEASSRDWSTTFGNGGGTPDISPTAFLVDVCDQIYVAGWGGATNGFGGTTGLAVTSDALQPVTDGSDFYLLVMDGDATTLQYATYFGDAVAEEHVDGGTSRFDRDGIVYQAVCAGCRQNPFPIYPDTASVAGPVNNSPNCNLGVFKFDLEVAVALADFDLPAICAPDSVAPSNGSVFADPSSVRFTWRVNDVVYTGAAPAIDFSDPGLYTIELVAVDSIACNISDSITRSIYVLGRPTGSVLDTIYRCEPGIVQIGLPASSDTSLTYAWTPAAPLSATDVPNPLATVSDDQTFTLVLSNGLCRDTVTQTVVLSPPAIDIAIDSVVCAEAPFTVRATDLDQAVYTWAPQTAVQSGQGTSEAVLVLDEPDTITVEMNLGGCVVRDTVVPVLDTVLPALTVAADPDTVDPGGASQLTAVSPEPAISWSPPDLLDAPTSFTPVATLTETTSFTATVVGSNGCAKAASVEVVVVQPVCEDNVLYVPNAFSPNGDGQNDIFRARGIVDHDGFELSVYDRWGQLIFRTLDPDIGWDGRFEGRDLNPAVFAWTVRGVCAGGERFESEGNVTLLR